jgi:recombination protein RecR
MQTAQFPGPILHLVSELRRLPGIGPRSAERIAVWLVQSPDARSKELASALAECADLIRPCSECGYFAEAERCAICLNPNRDPGLLCVVEQPTDIIPVERTGSFRGRYHCLGGRLSPLDHVGPEDLRIDALFKRVRGAQFHEIIFALSADVEGEATTNYLVEHLRDSGAQLTRIAQGMPAGMGIENADELTITRALTGRTSI